MDIYYAEATQLPMCYTIGRHYERTWIQGFDKTFNTHPLCPGFYFYTIWKGWYTPPSPPALASVSVLQGSSVSLSASFINPETKKPAAGILAFVQQSLDNATWSNIGAAITDINGCVNVSVIPPLGTAYYRIQSTGYWAPAQPSADLNAKYYEQLIESKALSQVMAPQIGASVKVTTRTVESIVTEALTPLATKSDISSLTTEIASLKTAVSSLTTYLYVSIGIALIAIVAAILAFTKKKGPSPE
jgi:hypothetical protein